MHKTVFKWYDGDEEYSLVAHLTTRDIVDVKNFLNELHRMNELIYSEIKKEIIKEIRTSNVRGITTT